MIYFPVKINWFSNEILRMIWDFWDTYTTCLAKEQKIEHKFFCTSLCDNMPSNKTLARVLGLCEVWDFATWQTNIDKIPNATIKQNS